MAISNFNKILLLGDSHAHVFKLVDSAAPDFSIQHCIVTGSSAQGAVNPHSKTNALPIFRDALSKNAESHTHCMTMLGEVDCGFVVWYRKKELQWQHQEPTRKIPQQLLPIPKTRSRKLFPLWEYIGMLRRPSNYPGQHRQEVPQRRTHRGRRNPARASKTHWDI